jgi:hypothetical protein
MQIHRPPTGIDVLEDGRAAHDFGVCRMRADHHDAFIGSVCHEDFPFPGMS